MKAVEVAFALGVSESSVYQWERSMHPPTRDKARQLDDVLKAEGAIVTACGYVPAEAALISRIERLEQILADAVKPRSGRPLPVEASRDQEIANLAIGLSVLEAALRDVLPEITQLRRDVDYATSSLEAVAARVARLPGARSRNH